MATVTEKLDDCEVRLLSYLRSRLGNRTKASVQHAWETGDYSNLGTLRDGDIATLQHLRNSRGPGWLACLSWKSIA